MKKQHLPSLLLTSLIVLTTITLEITAQVQEEWFLTGQAMDADRSQPLVFASVAAYSEGRLIRGTEADFNGIFSMLLPHNLPDLEIEVSYIGYQPQRKQIHQNEMEEVLDFAVSLNDGVRLDPIVVTAIDKRKNRSCIPCCYCVREKTSPIRYAPEPAEPISSYPNPFVNHLFVDLDISQAGPVIFQVYNPKGQVVATKTQELEKGPQKVSINLERQDIPNGNYWLRVLADRKILHSNTLIKVAPTF
ncbi:MAG: carboxypeptidase-like regulatory domain-containing protein [Bacteroidota bacterium]